MIFGLGLFSPYCLASPPRLVAEIFSHLDYAQQRTPNHPIDLGVLLAFLLLWNARCKQMHRHATFCGAIGPGISPDLPRLWRGSRALTPGAKGSAGVRFLRNRR